MNHDQQRNVRRVPLWDSAIIFFFAHAVSGAWWEESYAHGCLSQSNNSTFMPKLSYRDLLLTKTVNMEQRTIQCRNLLHVVKTTTAS